jgi:hypothetical protein
VVIQSKTDKKNIFGNWQNASAKSDTGKTPVAEKNKRLALPLNA